MYPQYNIERINNQIKELESVRNQYQNLPPPNVTQNFQLFPNNNSLLRYVNDIEEVKKEFVIGDTPFFSKDLSLLWIKNSKNEIRIFDLKEIIPKDEKDIMIESLQLQIEELKKEMKSNAKPTDDNVSKSTESKESTNV